MQHKKFEETLLDAVAGKGSDILMACLDIAIINVDHDADGSSMLQLSASAPEQIEAHVLSILLSNKPLEPHDEGGTLNA